MYAQLAQSRAVLVLAQQVRDLSQQRGQVVATSTISQRSAKGRKISPNSHEAV
jgi:hypothetical protein